MFIEESVFKTAMVPMDETKLQLTFLINIGLEKASRRGAGKNITFPTEKKFCYEK